MNPEAIIPDDPSRQAHLDETRRFWDEAAPSFDDQPDHGLRDSQVRAAWVELLRANLPPAPAAVLDVGCGTGSLSLILAELDYVVTGIDLSPAMIAQARAKTSAAGWAIRFSVMDAAFPRLGPERFDVLVCRHLLWSLPDQAGVLRRWADLLRPGGRLLLIEGYWKTAGMHSGEIVRALPPSLKRVTVQDLSNWPALWGGPVSDERYSVRADLLATG